MSAAHPKTTELYNTDLDRHLFTIESPEPGRYSRGLTAVAERLRESMTASWNGWKKASVIAYFL